MKPGAIFLAVAVLYFGVQCTIGAWRYHEHLLQRAARPLYPFTSLECGYDQIPVQVAQASPRCASPAQIDGMLARRMAR